MGNLAQILAVMGVGILVILCPACNSEPTAAFTADKTTIMAGESVQFSDASANDPTIWLWTFEGGNPSTSPSQNPLVSYHTPGTYSVNLEVRKRSASNIITKDHYITVEPANTDLTFINNTYTDVYISIGGVEKTAASGGQATYFDIDASSVNYYAETSGETNQGVQVGLNLSWDYTIQLTGGAQEYQLDIGTDFFFLFITNSGTHVLSPVVVEHGTDEPANEDITIPTDGVKYRIGYYYAWESTEIKAYYVDQPETYTVWRNLTYPGEINQNISVENPFKKGTNINGSSILTAGEPKYLSPATDFKPLKKVKEGVIRHLPNH